MGDRCYLEVSVRRRDLPRFTEILLGEKSTSPEDAAESWAHGHDSCPAGFVGVAMDEMNYGACSEREAAAGEGLIFFGSHGPGCEYGPVIFAAVDGKQIEADTNPNGCRPLVALDDDGEPMRSDLLNARSYQGMVARCKQIGRETELVGSLDRGDWSSILAALLLFKAWQDSSDEDTEGMFLAEWLAPLTDRLHGLESDGGELPGLSIEQLDELAAKITATLDDMKSEADGAE